MGAETWTYLEPPPGHSVGPGWRECEGQLLALSTGGGATCASAGVPVPIHTGNQQVNLHQHPTTVSMWLSAKTPRKEGGREGGREGYIFRVDL